MSSNFVVVGIVLLVVVLLAILEIRKQKNLD